MHDETRKTITAALHLVQQEVSLEANRVSRIRALIREYLSPPPPEKSPGTCARRARQIESELRRFAFDK